MSAFFLLAYVVQTPKQRAMMHYLMFLFSPFLVSRPVEVLLYIIYIVRTEPACRYL